MAVDISISLRFSHRGVIFWFLSSFAQASPAYKTRQVSPELPLLHYAIVVHRKPLFKRGYQSSIVFEIGSAIKPFHIAESPEPFVQKHLRSASRQQPQCKTTTRCRANTRKPQNSSWRKIAFVLLSRSLPYTTFMMAFSAGGSWR